MVRRLLAFLLSFAILIPLLTLDVGGSMTAAAASPAVRQCTDSSIFLTSSIRDCINGTDSVRTRGYSVQRCLPQVYKGGPFRDEVPVFERSTCSSGRYIRAELIAQSRFLQWLDARNRERWGDFKNVTPADPGQFSIHPGAQWEVTTKPRSTDRLGVEAGFWVGWRCVCGVG